jgi:hypothetical protein
LPSRSTGIDRLGGADVAVVVDEDMIRGWQRRGDNYLVVEIIVDATRAYNSPIGVSARVF